MDWLLVWKSAEVNCLAKAVAISRLRVKVLEEKVMGRLRGVSERFLLSDLIMLHML